ncbi:Integrase [Theobroma cacao]|nr:Integrase [Theobroma cacao]
MWRVSISMSYSLPKGDSVMMHMDSSRSVSKHLFSGLQKIEIAKELYEAVGERYQKSSKFEAGNLMNELTKMKYDSVEGDNKGHGNGQTKKVGGLKVVIRKEVRCFSCKKKGHMKHECPKYKSWLEKKNKQEGKSLALVCFEFYFVNAPPNSRWLDNGATVYVAITLQGFKSKRKPSEREAKLRVENNAEVDVSHANLILVSIMDKLGYYFGIGDGKVDLLCLVLNNEYSCMNVENIVSKRSLIKENSSLLWHKILGHISHERANRLIKNGILPNLDFEKVDTCVDCIKGKMIKTKKKGATRSKDLLEIVHIDISGLLRTTLCGNKYFVTFIDDFSRYGYLYLIDGKSNTYEKFKIFKTEVKKQLGKVINIAKFDQEGKYYGKHGTIGQHMGPFTKYLQEYGIIAQYTMLGSPEQNGVVERRNSTLMEMMRKVRIYNPSERKTKPRTTSCYFIGYPSHSKGYSIILVTIEREDLGQHDVNLPPQDPVLTPINVHPIQENEVEVHLRRYSRQRKSIIPIDYMFAMWMDTMKDEMSFMAQNGIWELIELPKGCRPIGYKWVYKTKKDSKGKLERFKAKLVAKGFTQREGVDYNETFSPVSSKDSFRIIMALVAYFDLELH